MPKYLITIKEVSPSDVPLDEGSHDSKQYRGSTGHSEDRFAALVVPASTAKFATLQSSILSAIGTAETP